MEILKTCLEEISLSGLEGCTLEELWSHLSDRQPPITFKLDQFIKPLAWKQLVNYANETNSLQMFKLPTPRVVQQTVFHSSLGMSFQWDEYKHPFAYHLINDSTTGVRGSCSTYYEREDVTLEIITKQVDFASATASYGNSLVLVTSQELRERVLSPLTQSPPVDIVDVQYGILEAVGCSRRYGMARPDITTKYIKIDPRSIYHHCKILSKLGLILIKEQRRNVSQTRSQLVHVVYLKRYVSTDGRGHEIETSLEKHFCELLEAAPYHTLSLNTLKEKIGTKKVKGIKAILVRRGLVRSVVMGEVAEEYANDPEVAKVKCCQLIKPFTEIGGSSDEGEGDEDEEGEDEGEGGGDVDLVPVVTELPVLTQGYRVVDSHGPRGIANQDFCFRKGLSLHPYINRIVSKMLVKRTLASAITVDDTPTRTIMLVADRHVHENSEYLRLREEMSKTSGCTKFEAAVITGASYLREKRVKKEVIVAEEAGPSRMEATPTAGIPGDEALLVPRQQVEGQDDEINQILQNVVNETDKVNRSPLETSPSVSVTGTPVPELKLMGTHIISQNPTPDSKVMTFHQLRRCNIIMEYMREHRVTQGHYDILQHVRSVERDIGREVVMEKKTICRLLRSLEEDGRVFHRDYVLEVSPEEGTIVNSDPLSFWCLSTVTEEEVLAAKEEAAKKYCSILQRRLLVGRKAKVKPVKKEEVISGDEGEGASDESDPTDSDEETIDKDSLPNIVASSKFQRLRHLHYFMWILANGKESCDATTQTKGLEDYGGEDFDKKEESSDIILSETNFPWAKVVSKLPVCSKGEGWIRFNDIHHYMPLSLWLILIKIYKGNSLKQLPVRYKPYLEDMELKNKLLHDVPRKLRKRIVHGNRDMAHIYDFLKQLVQLDLIVLDGDVSVRDKSNITVHLTRTVTILDTSTAEPRSSFWTNEARDLFEPVTFTFGSLADVERYWFQLQSTCLMTPIILRENPNLKDVDFTSKDLYPLVYSARATFRKNKGSSYNKLGFGAAGLPPLTFSHLSRNWKNVQQRSKKYHTRSQEKVVGGASYMPGEGLYQLPHVAMDEDADEEEVKGRFRGNRAGSNDNFGSLEVEEIKSLPPLKRAKIMAGVSVVPSGEVLRNSGGRGKERYRARRPAVSTKSEKSTDAQPHVQSRYHLAQAMSSIIADGPDSQDVRQEAHPAANPERAHWYPMEDSFLLQAYISAAVMKELAQPLVTFTMVQEAFLRQHSTTKYKTANAIKRRLNILLKKRAELAANLQVCVMETIQELNTLPGEQCPEPTFLSILEFVRKKYHSQDGSLSLPRSVFLPSSLHELQNYEIVGGPRREPGRLILTDSDGELNQALLTNLIIAVVGASESSFDQYKTFKLFESFPEADIEAAFELLKKRYLVHKSKTLGGAPRKQGANTTASYSLSGNYFSRLEHHHSIPHIRAMEDFRDFINKQLAPNPPSCDGHVISDPAISLVDSGVIKVDGTIVDDGTASAVISMVASGKNLVSCSSGFPHPLFEPHREGGEMLDGEEEEEEEGALREGSGQTARQLVKTAMEEAERGTNSDEEEEEDAMELGAEEGGASMATSKPAKETVKFKGPGVGYSSLFNFERGALKYKPIDLTPGFSIGKLLDPIPEPEWAIDGAFTSDGRNISADPSTREQDTPSLQTAEGVGGKKVLKLESFLLLVEKELGFSSSDVVFSRTLYDVISSGGERGVARETLKSHESISSLPHQLDFDYHVQTLLNFDLVHRMGINKECLVSHSHSNPWSMTVDDVTKGDTPFIPYVPWSSVKSSDPNPSMLTGLFYGIYNYIIGNPGVTVETLAVHFAGVLQPRAMKEILNVLELSGYVKRYSIQQRRVSCFSSCKQLTVDYYEPVLFD